MLVSIPCLTQVKDTKKQNYALIANFTLVQILKYL